MNFSVGFEPSQAEIMRWISRFGTAKHKKVVKTILKYALDIQTGAKQKLKEEKAIDTGILRNSIIVELTPDGLQAEIGTPLNYGPYIEFGTRPHFPPIDALEHWAKAHGIPAFLVARAISKRGLPARPYLYPAYDAIIAFFEQALAADFEGVELI